MLYNSGNYCIVQNYFISLHRNVEAIGNKADIRNLQFDCKPNFNINRNRKPPIALGLRFFRFFVPQQIRCQPYTFVGLIGMVTLNFSQPLAVQRDLIRQRMDIPSWQSERE